ncbi:MAG: hypothetical protein IKJ73_00400 [Lachnospiraceae bacterium]|nr:hypothetical protein [Lachnospiraceae bacterium]
MSFLNVSNTYDYMNNFFGASATNGSSGANNFLGDYYAVQNGSYYKLAKNFYAKAAAEEKISDSVDEKSVELVKSGAEEAINSLNKLMDEGLFEKGESDDKDAILDKLNSFVKDYNAMINNAGEMDGENSLKAGVRLVDQMKVYKSALSRIGVSIESDNTLKVDEDAFKESDISDVKNLFTGNVSMAKNIQSKLLQVYSSANMDLKSTDGLYSAQAIKNVTLGSMFDSIT